MKNRKLTEDEELLLDRYSRLDPDRKELLRGWALELVINLTVRTQQKPQLRVLKSGEA